MSRYLWQDAAERITRQVLSVFNLTREEEVAEAFRLVLPLVLDELRLLEIRRAREEKRLAPRPAGGEAMA
jgi:hypothetical protein